LLASRPVIAPGGPYGPVAPGLTTKIPSMLLAPVPLVQVCAVNAT
jgi:hypothetical protein